MGGRIAADVDEGSRKAAGVDEPGLLSDDECCDRNLVGAVNDDAVGLGICKVFVPQNVDEVSWVLLGFGVPVGELVYKLGHSSAGLDDLEFPFAEHVGCLRTGDGTYRVSYVEEDLLFGWSWECGKHW